MVSAILEDVMARTIDIYTDVEVVESEIEGGMKKVVTVDKMTGRRRTFSAKELFLAAGRRSNADLLKTEKTGVEVDDRGYIKVNEFLETTKPRILAFGDAIGKYMFKHVANYETEIAWYNFSGQRSPVDYSSVPYAVFSNPQVASVGLTEAEANAKGFKVLVGEYEYKDTAKGAAMGVEDGFVKVIVDEDSYRILGAHIIGPHAPILMQEIVNAMNTEKGTIEPIQNSMYIHPALPEVVQRAFFRLHRHDHDHN